MEGWHTSKIISPGSMVAVSTRTLDFIISSGLFSFNSLQPILHSESEREVFVINIRFHTAWASGLGIRHEIQ